MTEKRKKTKIKVKIEEKLKNKAEENLNEESTQIVFDPEKNEQDKNMVMIAGVAFFMVLIIGLWLLNIKNIFQLNPKINSKDNFNWGEMKKELNSAMGEMKKNINEIKNLQSTTSTSSPQTSQSAEMGKNIELLKERLADKILFEQATTTVATTSPVEAEKESKN